MNKIYLRAGTLFATAWLLAGCVVAPNYYKPSGSLDNPLGYDQRQVDGALFRVSFLARSYASTDEVYAYTLYRAAEVAKEQGATHFEVLEGLLDRAMLERFIASPVKTSLLYDPNAFDMQPKTLAASTSSPASGSLASSLLPVPTLPVHYRRATPNFVYVPVQPPPPPKHITLLVRLLNAPSLDPHRGFDVTDVLARIGPKILRIPKQPV